MTDELDAVIDDVAHFLPAQGPISVFIHHNTIHAFESQPFESAVEAAADLLGAEPWLPELRYREELVYGRIREAHVAAELRECLGVTADDPIGGVVSRLQLRQRVSIHGLDDARGSELSWALSEGDALRRFRDDVPTDAREVIAAARGWTTRSTSDEPRAVRLLWEASRAAVRHAPARPFRPKRPDIRHRDLLLAVHDIDIDDWIHPPLIRFVAAFLDQGLARWPMDGRERGMFECFLDTHGAPFARLAAPWAGDLRGFIREERRLGRSAHDSLAATLAALSVPPNEWFGFLCRTALALRGFAGMIRQIEERPDRVPAHAVPARLVDFLAIRLLCERAALCYLLRTEEIGTDSLAKLREVLRARVNDEKKPRTILERAWQIFQLAQLCGLDAAGVGELSPTQVAELETELEVFDGNRRRALLHRAYERHLRQRWYDALLQHHAQPEDEPPRFQAVFCIDDREESIRRHLEEVEPAIETFGSAGFYGSRCSTGVPRTHILDHFVPSSFARNTSSPRRVARPRGHDADGAFSNQTLHFGSQTLIRGAIVMTTLGALALLPLMLRVMIPWLRPSVSHLDFRATTANGTRLHLLREPTAPPIGRFSGFSIEEMVGIVGSQLENIGLAAPGRLSPLVFIFGHGSVSLNNPHKSAYDCGACGGGKGGPNARAFAQMANDPDVRAGLLARNIVIPESTWFVGGERNTSDGSMRLFDLDRVPAHHRAPLAHARAVFERARRLEAHERCRRFAIAANLQSAQAALRHVEGRADDLAQPRPECGHATNAVCFIGRRHRTRGLFLDRRAFLISYDPTTDSEHSPVLARILNAVVPVIAGISLEYWFSYVDPTVYGCGTKLPHNVTSLLGVMDGAQSDLRTGLPWQMTELHEPVRLTIVIETVPAVLEALIAQNEVMRELVERQWLHLASIDPTGPRLWEYSHGEFVSRTSERALSVVRGGSQAVYSGKPGHLPFCRVVCRGEDTASEEEEPA